MPRYRQGSSMGFISTNDLSASPVGSIVKIDTSATPDHIVLATAGTDVSVGVLLDQPLAGQTASVRLRNCDGTNFVKLGGSVTVNDAVTATTGGAAITTTTSGNQILGYALQSGSSGDVIEILPSMAKY